MTSATPPPPPPDAGDLKDLIEQWASFVETLEQQGYTFDLDNWLNDVDVRELILEALPMFGPDDLGPAALRLEAADKAFLAATRDFRKCVWGQGTARREKWSADRNWWYFRVPLKSNGQLDDELATVR